MLRGSVSATEGGDTDSVGTSPREEVAGEGNDVMGG